MPRPEFESVVAQAPKKYLFQFFQENTDTIAAGVSQGIAIFAPDNHICMVTGMRVSATAPVGATTGTHRFIVGYDMDNAIAGSANIDLLLLQSAFGDDVLLNEMTAVTATDTTIPAPEQFPINISQIRIDSETPMSVTYRNSTDVDQTDGRIVMLTLIAEQVAG